MSTILATLPPPPPLQSIQTRRLLAPPLSARAPVLPALPSAVTNPLPLFMAPRISTDSARPPSYAEPPSYFATLGLAPGAPGSSRPARYASIVLSGTDRLRLVGFPDEDISAVVDVVDLALETKWGVQARICPRSRVFEWKLKGRPWGGDGWNDEVTPIRLLGTIFSGLSLVGWHIAIAADVAFKVSSGRDSLFLRQGPAVHRSVFALTFRKPGILVLVDAPLIVQNVFIRTVKSWHEGVQSWEQENGHVKINLYGQLWPAVTDHQALAVRELLCDVLAVVDELGYELVTSLNFAAQPAWKGLAAAQTGRSRGSGNLDSWFFATKPNPSPANTPN